jgi:hypothetical protein
MPLIRARQVAQLVRPTLRAMPLSPLLLSGLLGAVYVELQAPDRYIDQRIMVLRLAGLALCIGAAFALDDPTEDTVDHVPTPSLLRRLVRVALAAPIAASLWVLFIRLTGDVPPELGGPLPAGALTLEIGATFVVAMAATSAGVRVAADRLGAIAAAPAVLGLAAVSLVLPLDNPLLMGSPSSPSWDEAHESWRLVLAVAAAFVLVNRDPGRYRIGWRARSLRAGRKIGRPRVT